MVSASHTLQSTVMLTAVGFNMSQFLVDMEAKATFPCDIGAGANAKQKCKSSRWRCSQFEQLLIWRSAAGLSDCETFIKAIHFVKESGVREGINRRAGDGDADASTWCELRHYLGRRHSFRQAAERIFRASKLWPEVFHGFTVDCIATSRPVKHSIPKHLLSTLDMIQAAFPSKNLEEYYGQIENLQEHNLDSHIRDQLPLKSIRQFIHCEVHLEDFLVGDQKVEPSAYWENSIELQRASLHVGSVTSTLMVTTTISKSGLPIRTSIQNGVFPTFVKVKEKKLTSDEMSCSRTLSRRCRMPPLRLSRNNIRRGSGMTRVRSRAGSRPEAVSMTWKVAAQELPAAYTV